jgi:molybdopterin molybdotransferase
MQGLSPASLPRTTAVLGRDLPENGTRMDFMRSALDRRDGALVATPFPVQDSSMISLFATSGALVIRPPGAPAAHAGEEVEILPLAIL